MCGRFVSASNPEQIAAYFDAAPPQTELTPSYNVAPTTDIYAVVEVADGSRRVEVFHWGLIPVWAKDVKIGQKMINARAETVATKGAFKADFKRHRCLIPMDGFYEWHAQPDRKPKQPYFVHRVDGEPLAVAGLWSTWRDRAAGPDADWLHSCTVVTTTANAHDGRHPRSDAGHPPGVGLGDLAGPGQPGPRCAGEAPRARARHPADPPPDLDRRQQGGETPLIDVARRRDRTPVQPASATGTLFAG